MKQIFIGHHFFGAGNIGDDLMLAGFLAAVRGKQHHLSLSCSIPHPLETQARRFPEIRWLPYDESIRRETLAASTVWLGLGGSPFQSDDSEWFTDHLREEFANCRKLGIPMYFLGVGVNNAAVLARAEIREFLAAAERIWARDRRSYELLRSASAAPEKVALGADLAHCAFVQERFTRAAPTPGTFGYCLNFQDELARHQLPLEVLLSRSDRFQQQWQVQEVRELPGAERAMYRRLPPGVQCSLPEIVPDFEEEKLKVILDGLPSCEYFLSSRYHSAIVQAWSGAKLGIFAINDKLRGIAEELDVPVYEELSQIDPRVESCFRRVSPGVLEDLAIRAYGSVVEFLQLIGADERPRGESAAEAPRFTGKEKLLVVCPDSLGDLVLREPLLSSLIAMGCDCTVACRPASMPLLPFLHPKLQGLEIDFHPYSVDLSSSIAVTGYRDGIMRFLERVRIGKFQRFLFPAYNRTIVEESLLEFFPETPVICLSPGVDSAITLRSIFPKLREVRRVRSASLKHVAVQKIWHESEKLKAFAASGLELPGELSAPKLRLSERSARLARRILDEHGLCWGRYVLACPFGTVNVKMKAVPENLAALALKACSDRIGLPVLLIGVHSEKQVLEALRARCEQQEIPTRLWIGSEDQLDRLLGLLSGAYCYFGGDTGPTHMSLALGIPTFAVMGGGTYPRFLPQGEHGAFIAHPLACFGCDWSCIFPTAYCLTRISEERLRAGVEAFLAAIPTSSASGRHWDGSRAGAAKSLEMPPHGLSDGEG